MSDKQKGLVQAFQEIFPHADHRFCVRHMHANFKNAGYRGQAYKIAVWRGAKASTINEFGIRMEQLRALDEKAYEWFHDKPPKEWSMSHFNIHARSDMLLNNVCETFNNNILEGREKAILSMLEWLQNYLMRRSQQNRDMSKKKWKIKSNVCPRIKKIIDHTIEKLADCWPMKADDKHYQINCAYGNEYSVDLEKMTCRCRKWDLTGIPCKHAISAINCQGWDINDYTHPCCLVETYEKVYEPVVMPINGRSEWPKTGYIPPLPPNFGRPAGRPSKARRREPDELLPKKKKKQGQTTARSSKQIEKTPKDSEMFKVWSRGL